MYEGQKRDEMRAAFFALWEKRDNLENLEGMDRFIVELMINHPEYHDVFNNKDHYMDYEFTGNPEEENPFLHIALHLSVAEQLHTDQPKGIRDVFQTLCAAYPTPHDAEHEIMMGLAIEMHESQASGNPFNEQNYLAGLRRRAEA